MRFRFAARVIAQLGAELISSDDIAIYELIKNAFDAGSARVKLEIRYLASIADVARVQGEIRGWFQEKAKVAELRKQACLAVDKIQPIAPEWGDALQVEKARIKEGLATAKEEATFITLVGGLNEITISDAGHGMDQGTLQDCFLTIGTTHRLNEHEALEKEDQEDEEGEAESVRIPAGEKGIGRLSVMRLGNDLRVRTWTTGAEEVNVLTIDWRVFSPQSTKQAYEIDMDVTTEERTEEQLPSGTVLSITDLQSPWDWDKTEDVVTKFLSRFLDPFATESPRTVDILWNGQDVEVPPLSRRYLEAAQNGMKGALVIGKDRRFTLTVNYWFTNGDTGERRTLTRTYSSADFGGLMDAAVELIGPFSFELFHYNRLRVTAIPGFATRKQVKDWLDEWAGGLMLYRDGLRVMPYGRMPDDDWLELDQHALRRSGFRVNRIQIVGCVRISRLKNPRLQDQTNREGLRDNAAALNFRNLLQRIIQELFVKLLDQQERPEGRTDEELIHRSVNLQSAVDDAVERLTHAAEQADLGQVETAKRELKVVLEGVPQITNDLREAVQTHALHRVEILELAATGMTAMSLAHDLEAALDEAASETGVLSRSAGIRGELKESLTHLVALFKSLRTLVSDIKPGPAKTRRRKSTFDIGGVLEQLTTFYGPRLERDNIEVEVVSNPAKKPFRVKAVEGHVRQVLDNLYRNSMYWLVDTHEKRPTDIPRLLIRVVLDHRSKTLSFSDTGVGIAPHDNEWIFESFTTHRKGGYGLGLYISKELCKFNGISIAVDPASVNKFRRHDKIILDCSQCYVEG
jgi:signal transduction histidine kinase